MNQIAKSKRHSVRRRNGFRCPAQVREVVEQGKSVTSPEVPTLGRAVRADLGLADAGLLDPSFRGHKACDAIIAWLSALAVQHSRAMTIEG